MRELKSPSSLVANQKSLKPHECAWYKTYFTKAKTIKGKRTTIFAKISDRTANIQAILGWLDRLASNGKVALKVCVADGHPLLAKRANYVTTINGGRGAVREVCDLILQARNELDVQRLKYEFVSCILLYDTSVCRSWSAFTCSTKNKRLTSK